MSAHMHVSRDSLESPLETVKAEKDGLSDAVIEMCGTACKDTLPSSSAAENRAWGPTGGSATDGADCGLKRIAVTSNQTFVRMLHVCR